jgi:chromosome segregation ATPase
MAQQQEMSYAQALNEAKQVIIQQSSRIKGDLEKIKGQQQTIVDQAARVSEYEARIAEQSSEIQRQASELRGLEQRYAESEAGRQQAEGVLNRQGERINHLEVEVADFTAKLEEANTQIADLTRERDDLRSQLPTAEDIEALNGMMALLSQKHGNESSSSRSMRIVAEAA